MTSTVINVKTEQEEKANICNEKRQESGKACNSTTIFSKRSLSSTKFYTANTSTMACLRWFVSFFKVLAIITLLFAIAIPIRYGSTHPKYLRLRFLHSMVSMVQSFSTDLTRPNLSADYRAFELLLRYRPLVKVDKTIDALEMVKRVRASFSLGSTVTHPDNCQITKHNYEYEGHSVDTYWIGNRAHDEKQDSNNILLYFHGGAYLTGNVQGELSMFSSHEF
jgi:hypothetical protein